MTYPVEGVELLTLDKLWKLLLVSVWLLMTIHLLGNTIITTHTRLFSSCLSIYVFLIASLLCFPRSLYVLLPELLSVNKWSVL